MHVELIEEQADCPISQVLFDRRIRAMIVIYEHWTTLLV